MKYKNIIKIGMIAVILLAIFGMPIKSAAEWTWDPSETEWGQKMPWGDKGTWDPTETTWWNADDSGDITSFSDFEGGLEAPSGKDLSKTLTRASSVREFIKNTINLALSFLGLIAMAIIIYGGFLYVTAAGNEEQSGKGKKAITYAGVGIIIIVASFAIVNTLINFVGTGESDRTGKEQSNIETSAGSAGQGGGPGNLSSGAEGGAGAGGQQAFYNIGVVEINASLKEFMGAYKNLVAVDSLIKKVKALAKPKDVSENKAYFNEVVEAVTQIKNKSNALSKTHVEAKKMLEGWLAEVSNMDFSAKDFLYKDNLKKSVEEGVSGIEDGLPGLVEESKNDFTATLETISAPDTVKEKDKKGKLDIVGKILKSTFDKKAGAAINEAVQSGFINEKDIAKALAGIDATKTIGDIFDDAKKSIDDAKKLADDPSQTDLVIKTVKSLHDLYVVVKNIQFVSVRIKASVKEGNAPLVVELNGLDSRDPAGKTIPEENYIWDPDGDGEDGTNSNKVECTKGSKGPTITCIYKQTGTYIVGLSIASQDALRIAAGKATFAITVKPSIARIALKATAGSISEELRKYAQDASGQWQILIDKTEFQVTTSEAKKNGVSFDASESKGGDDQPLIYEWSFGDGSAPEKDKPKIDNHKYNREGKFQLILEVTDTGKRKDRKIVNIIVASIAARIGAAKTIAEPDELVEFDGSLSRSDNGQINSYNWIVTNEKGSDITNLKNDLETVGNADSSTLRVKFKKPGSYNVKLEVSDGNKSANAQVPISIKSRKPRANFVIKTCPENCADKTKPGIAEFDASSSFDPDKSDVLTYNWEFSDESDQKLEKDLKFKVLENGELSGKNAKKLKVEFNETGKYKARLKVNDSHEDQNILQEDEKEKGFEITSIVGAYWDRDIKTVEKLKDGKAGFEFAGKVANADRVEIDFGDGLSNEKEIVGATKNVEQPFKFEHEYEKAGSFLVSIKATSDEGNGENTLQKRVYVSGGESPLAVMQIFEDKNEIIMPEEGDQEPFETIRNKLIKFDASNSINSAGEKNEKGKDAVLKFSWNFGDGDKSPGATVEHSYEDVSPEGSPFKVTLTVSEFKDPNKISEAKFLINVVGKKPELNTLSLEKKSAGETTPVDVEVTAEGAIDPDGKVKNYQFWYYDPLDKEQKLGVVDTQYNQATLTIETAGEADEEHEYVFCVNLTDNENTTSTCEELFGENELPKIKVKNGANKAPTATFSADKTSAKVGEAITFTSSSKDEDGKIKEYIWDLDGDGFQNDNPTELSAITQIYKKPSPKSGYKVKLKAIDDKNAAGFSKEIPIYIAAKSNPPKANFSYIVEANPPRHVKFFDSSTADTDNGAKIVKWTWDFDTSSEFGCDKAPKPEYCNGNKADDIDSQDQNPFYDFPNSATYQVKLTVEDSDGNISEPKTAIVNVISGASSVGGSAGAQTPVSNILNAELKTFPEYKFIGTPPQKTVIIPKGSKGETVAFFYGNSTGSIISYKLDKNTWCDSGGKFEAIPDGKRWNDVDFIYPDPDYPNAGKCVVPSTGAAAESCWTTNYNAFAKTGSEKGPGHFMAKLTATDITNAQDEDTVEIVFEDKINPTDVLQGGDCDGKIPMFTGSLFNKLNYSNSILLGLGAGVIVILSIFGIFNLIKKGGKRE